jgi:hypothetical protein
LLRKNNHGLGMGNLKSRSARYKVKEPVAGDAAGDAAHLERGAHRSEAEDFARGTSPPLRGRVPPLPLKVLGPVNDHGSSTAGDSDLRWLIAKEVNPRQPAPAALWNDRRARTVTRSQS